MSYSVMYHTGCEFLSARCTAIDTYFRKCLRCMCISLSVKKLFPKVSRAN